MSEGKDRFKDSPFKGLFYKPTQKGNERYLGAAECPCCHQGLWVSLFPNQKRHQKQPDYHVSLNPREDR